jgi:hypothetical protein
MTLSPIRLVFLTLGLFMFAVSAAAQLELPAASIGVRDGPTGSVILELSWLVPSYCFPFGASRASVVSLSGQLVSITTVNDFFDCPPPPPDLKFTPMRRRITADAGHLADGRYSVLWSFATPAGWGSYPPLPPPMSAQFVVSGGSTQVAEVPTLSAPTLLLLLLMLTAAGWRAAA